MTKKHEELVEEIEKIFEDGLCAVCGGPNDNADVVAKVMSDAITLILSAVRDGLPLPGEVGRATLAWPNAHLQGWFLRMKNKIGQGAMFIALEGTGKEEEALETNDIPRYCEHCGSEEHYTSEHY